MAIADAKINFYNERIEESISKDEFKITNKYSQYPNG